MVFKRFEDIVAWQVSQNLAVQIYQLFREIRDFGFRDQLFRAVVSISNNIAEGFDRASNVEFARFLIYARGSNSEVKSMLYLSIELGYLSKEQADNLLQQTERISKLLNGLIKSLKPQTPSTQTPST